LAYPLVFGRNTARTLRMAEDALRLVVEIDPPDSQWARDLITSIERGDISAMPFCFDV
jgi:phage head maturation protease